MATTFKGYVVTVKDGYTRNGNNGYEENRDKPSGRYHVVAQFAQTSGGDIAEFCGATVGQNAVFSLTMQFDIAGSKSDERNEAFSEKMKKFTQLMEDADKYITLSAIGVAELCDHSGYKINGVDYTVRSRNIAHWKSVPREEIVTRMRASLLRQASEGTIEWIDNED